MSEGKKHVYEAINQVTAAMASEGLGKTRKNDQQGYRFRGIDDVYNAIARHLASAKLCMLPRVASRSVTERPTKTGGVSTYVVLEVDFTLVSAVDGSSHCIRTIGEAMDTADKATNKAMSAAMKYACLLAFQIPTEGDNDADAHHHAPAAPLEKQLASSIAWGALEKQLADLLRAATTKGELMEAWTAVLEQARTAPNGTLARLASVKDDLKLKLQVNGADAR